MLKLKKIVFAHNLHAFDKVKSAEEPTDLRL